MSRAAAIQAITRQYLPQHLRTSVESRVAKQSEDIAAPILVEEELLSETAWSGLMAMSDAVANLTHELDLGWPIYWCVTESPAMNAMITTYGSLEVHVVIVARGILDTLFPVCVALVESDQLTAFLRDDVDPIDDQTPATRSRRQAWEAVAGRDPRVASLGFEAAFPLTYLSSHFLMAHEIAHLSGGHLDLFAGSFAAEVQGSRDVEREGLDADATVSRALERDADALAAAATTYLLARFASQPAWSRYLTDKTAGLRYFFVATYILFSVMDLLGSEDGDAEDRTHPPAMVRAGTTSVMLGLVLDQFGDVEKESAWDVARRSIRAVEIAIFELAGGIMNEAEAQLLQLAGERGAVEQARVWPDIQQHLDRRHLDKYHWATPLR